MRGLALAWLALAGVLACGPPPDSTVAGDLPAAYLRDARARRAALVASLQTHDNRYSSLRLARYATGAEDDWDRLPVWNPPVAALDEAGRSLASSALPIDDEARPLPPAALHVLGEAAFFRYPVQLAPAIGAPSPALAARYGLWSSETRAAGALVRAQLPDGSFALALTCATCHARVEGAEVVAGLANADLQLGRMLVDASGTADSADAQRLLVWGPGRVDVTSSDGALPEQIPDLRPVRWLSHLHYDATVRQQDLVSLAIRVETLIVTSHGMSVRPPRIVALALAQFLWDLGDALLPPPAGTRGAAIFSARCSACHAGPGLTGAPVALEVVGTDPTLGRSPERGTGLYRIPSLRGVARRATLLHDGSVGSVAALLDPARLDAGYDAGARAAGPIQGHAFGLDLDPSDREALLAFLMAL